MEKPADQVRTRTIYFHADDDHATAQQLARASAHNGKKGITRKASVFITHDTEPCDAVCILPGVRDWDAARIITSYEAAGIPISKIEKGEKLPEPVAEPAAPNIAPLPPPPKNDALRRLPSAQLKALAAGRGVDITNAHDRAAIIAAIEAAAQKGPTP